MLLLLVNILFAPTVSAAAYGTCQWTCSYGGPPASVESYGGAPAPLQVYGGPPAPMQTYGGTPAPVQGYGGPPASVESYGGTPAPPQSLAGPPAIAPVSLCLTDPQGDPVCQDTD